MPESRRVKLTKRLITEAFIELLESKPLAKVTVTDVCNIAEINRSTFYAYYEDVPSLMREIQEEVISRIPAPESLPTVVESLERFLDMMVPLFDYIKKNSRLFNVLVVQAECDDFAERIVRTVLERYPKNFFEKDDLEREYRAVFCLNGFIGIFKLWITEDFPITSRQFATLALSTVASCADMNLFGK